MIVIVTIAKFVFDSTLGKILVGAAAGSLLFGTWLLSHDYKVRAKERTAVVTSINQEAEKIGDKAVENRNRADVPDPVAELRKRTCGDCKR